MDVFGLEVFDAICPLVTKVHIEVGEMPGGERDLVIVVGSPNSFNSRRLAEVAISRGIAGYLVDRPDEIDPAWLVGKERIGVSTRASAPEILLHRVVDRVCSLTGAGVAQLASVDEDITFHLLRELAEVSRCPWLRSLTPWQVWLAYARPYGRCCCRS